MLQDPHAVTRGELSLALNIVSSLSGTSEHNLESSNSEFTPKRKIGVVVITKSQEHLPGPGHSSGPLSPHLTPH